MRVVLALSKNASLLAVIIILLPAPRPAPAQAQAGSLPPSAQRAYDAVAPRFDAAAAMEVVNVMSGSWRLAGNPGFNASIDHIRDPHRHRLLCGHVGGRPDPRGRIPTRSPGWDYSVGTVSIFGADASAAPEVLLSRERDRVSLASTRSRRRGRSRRRRSSTWAQARRRTSPERTSKARSFWAMPPLGQLWQQAVKGRGAAGVISTSIAPYIRPADPAAFTSRRSAGRPPVGQRPLRRRR